MGNVLFITLLSFYFLFFDSSISYARRVYFSASARASATSAKVRNPLQATCMIAITNPNASGTGNQTYSVQFTNIQAIKENASTPEGPATDPSGQSLTGTLTPGSTVTWTYLYPMIMGTIGAPLGYDPQQRIICSGYIEVDDSSDNLPGFIVGSGTLTVYQDTQAGVNNMGTTGNGAISFVSYKQIPIIIGGGKPF